MGGGLGLAWGWLSDGFIEIEKGGVVAGNAKGCSDMFASSRTWNLSASMVLLWKKTFNLFNRDVSQVFCVYF